MWRDLDTRSLASGRITKLGLHSVLLCKESGHFSMRDTGRCKATTSEFQQLLVLILPIGLVKGPRQTLHPILRGMGALWTGPEGLVIKLLCNRVRRKRWRRIISAVTMICRVWYYREGGPVQSLVGNFELGFSSLWTSVASSQTKRSVLPHLWADLRFWYGGVQKVWHNITDNTAPIFLQLKRN